MSKKKISTTKSADRPSMIPIMKSKAAKKKGRGPTEANGASQATPLATTDTPPIDDAGATAAETPPADHDQAAADVGQPTRPATESPAKGKKTKAKKESKRKKMSCLDAAAKVLTDAGTAMTSGEMIEAMAKKGLWSSPNGQTPAATLYSAIAREINTKGKDARFKKTERGKFATKA